MKTIVSNYWPWAVVFVLAFLMFFVIHKRFKERNVWGNIVKRYRENTDEKILTEAAFVTRFGTIENNSILYKLDRLVLTSGLKTYFPWLSGEIFLLAMIVLSIAGFFEGIIIFGNFFVALFLSGRYVPSTVFYISSYSG